MALAFSPLRDVAFDPTSASLTVLLDLLRVCRHGDEILSVRVEPIDRILDVLEEAKVALAIDDVD